MPSLNAMDALHATMTHCVASEVMAGFTHAWGGVSPSRQDSTRQCQPSLNGKDLDVFDMVNV